MSTLWQRPFRLNKIDDEWDKAPSFPGVYIISLNKQIHRVGGIDKAGILYIGKSRTLRDRLWEFWNTDHDASAYLWENPRIASKVLGFRRLSSQQLERHLGNLKARIARIPLNELASAEEALLYAYVMNYGELPPLNFSFPRRWEGKPDARLLRWAKTGLRI